MKKMMDYELYTRGIDSKVFEKELMQTILYGSNINKKNDTAIIQIKKTSK